MLDSGMKQFIESNVLAFATLNKDNLPHVIAVAYCKVFDDLIIISNAHITESIDNLQHSNKVALAIWNKEWEEACIGYEFRGTAENHTDGKWFDFVKSLPDNDGYDIKSAIVVHVEKIKELLS